MHGKHSFRAGTSLLDQRSKQAAPFNGRGVLMYNSSPGYTGLANFLDDFGGSGGAAGRDFGTQNYYPVLFRQAYFAQDRWRVSALDRDTRFALRILRRTDQFPQYGRLHGPF